MPRMPRDTPTPTQVTRRAEDVRDVVANGFFWRVDDVDGDTFTFTDCEGREFRVTVEAVR